MKIKFKSTKIYYDNVLMAACPASEALFELIGSRQYLRPLDLPLVSKMGFDIEITGNIHPLSEEMVEKELRFGKNKDKLEFKGEKAN